MTDPAVLVVDDDSGFREALLATLQADDCPVRAAASGAAALQEIATRNIGLVISDLQMQPMDGATLLRQIHKQHPDLPTVLMTAHGSVETAVDVMREGAVDYLLKPFDTQKLRAIISRYLPAANPDQQLIASDARSQELLALAARVAATDATVMINGESGSGKEVMARYLHQKSRRSEQPFVAINCAAIPENMLEATLFGYEKGAFTGASSAHAGKFEQAHGGTLLLDEISEMDLGLQAKLLRVLQEREIERIGGRRTLPIDVRVLATTNRDLRQHVADGRFREDLYYRLNVFPLYVPPLRDRPDDIVPLAVAALQAQADGQRRVLTDAARVRLRSHPWPGNVRELQNLIQRTAILVTGERIEATDIAFETAPASLLEPTDSGELQTDLRRREEQIIIDALREHGGRRNKVARALGISARTLRYKLARMRDAGIAIPGEDDE